MKHAFLSLVFLLVLPLTAQPVVNPGEPGAPGEKAPAETPPAEPQMQEPAKEPAREPVENSPTAPPDSEPPKEPGEPREPELPGASVDVELKIVSNFIDQGEDVGAGYTRQRREKLDGFTAPWFVQPSVTFHTPVEGLFVNVFGSFAMRGRADTDADQRLETGPSGNQTLLTDSTNPFVNNTGLTPLVYIRDQIIAAGVYPSVSVSSIQAYNFYKDENGLYRRDQIDLTIGYERETSVGVLGGGIIASNRTAPKGKSNPFGDSGANYQATEMYVSYALPFFTDLKVLWYGDIVSSDQRLEADIGHEFEIADQKSISVSAVTGYGFKEGLQGWQDVDLGAEFILHSFVFGLHWVYRPTLAFFDEDSDLTTNIIQADGLSNRRDGLVADPRKTGIDADIINGLVTSRVQALSGNTAYAYTPRQRLPKWINYVSLGYRMSF